MAVVFWAVILLAGLSCTSAKLGTPATIEEFPSVVQVENLVATVWLQQCVGSVLTSYHILSAASCFTDVTYNSRTRRVRAGTSIRGYGGSVHEVYTAYIHPSYGQLDKDGDLAVVRLEKSFELGETIKQASILGEGIYLPYGLTVTLVGWGTTTEGGLVGSNDLYSLEVNTINEYKCIYDYYDPENPAIITENMFCVGLEESAGRDFDSRDAGAPLYYSGVTVGLCSFGKSSSEDKYPIVNTAIASYSNWIVETAKL